MADGVKDPASLENLHDIVAPGPAPWWPPAPGWYVFGVLLLGAVLMLTIRAILRWRRNQYRRHALSELQRIQSMSHEHDDCRAAIGQLDEILKRVALAAWPREEVASLTGERWLAFLRRTGPGLAFDQQDPQSLRDVVYNRKFSARLSATQLESLFSAASEWIARHDPSIPVTEQEEHG